mgnify:CR=1 FL=1
MAGGLVYGCVVPHPPVLLPEVGGDMAAEVEPTVEALREIGRNIAAYEPDTLVLISPHGPLQRDAMSIGLAPAARGDFAQFNAPGVSLQVSCDVELARAIQSTCERVVIAVRAVDELTGSPSPDEYRLDHGAAVPLHFLLPLMGDVRVVLLGFSYQPRSTHAAFGNRIREACEALDRRAVFVASGDLSHRLLPTAPAGYDPQGEVFDEEIVAALAAGDWDRIRNLPQPLVERAGVCGYHSILTLAGAMGGDIHSRVLSYQGPFGVGYVVAEVEPGPGPPEARSTVGSEQRGVGLTAATSAPDAVSRPSSGGLALGGDTDAFVFEGDDFGQQVLALARASLETYITHRARLALPADLPADFVQSRSCFVTLTRDGQLRGCVGSIVATRESLARELVDNAINAGTRDYRFAPISRDELPTLRYSVDILSPLEPARLDDMDPVRFGMVVMRGSQVGVLLPGIAEIRDVQHQFEVCCQKAGITTPDGIDLFRFTVTRYAEPGAEH